MRATIIVLGVGATALLAALLLGGCGKDEPEGYAPAVPPATEEAQPTQDAAQPDQDGPQIAQTICPVMGGQISPNIYVDHNGRRVYFCCKGCVEPFRKDPEKYLRTLDKGAVPPETQKHGAGHDESR